MNLSRKQVSLILLSVCMLLVGWYVHVQLRDDRSFLFQLREIFFPTKYSQGQTQNFQSDIASAATQWKHHDLGKKYYEAGEYEKSIAEYKTAIEIGKQDARDWAQINNQKFPRGALIEVYEKAGYYAEAIEQIDWLLAHKPSETYRSELLIWKKIITAENIGQYEQALGYLNEVLSSGEFEEYKFVIPKFHAKREELQKKVSAIVS